MFFLKNITIYILCFVLIYASWLCSDVFFNVTVQPYIILLTLSYWAIYKPSLFHPAVIFCLSLFYDVLLNNMIGFHSVIFLTIYFALRSQRNFFLGQTYIALFAVFTFIISVYALFHWLLLSVSYNNVLPYEYFFHNVVISILLLPLLSFFFLGLRKLLSVEIESHRI